MEVAPWWPPPPSFHYMCFHIVRMQLMLDALYNNLVGIYMTAEDGVETFHHWANMDLAHHTKQTSLTDIHKTLLTSRLLKTDPFLQTYYENIKPDQFTKIPIEVAGLLHDVPECEIETDEEWD